MDKIAKYIDHTFLKKNAKKEEVEKVCDEAIKYGFKGVCVFPKHLPIVVKKLKNKKPLAITVVDFPLGNGGILKKEREAKKAIKLGAQEIDMVMDVLALKNKDYDKVLNGIKAVVKIAKTKPVKVIIETCYLNKAEIIIACVLAKLAKAKFVKTSTGFGKSGADVEDVLLMKTIVGDVLQVKASGGIKTFKDAMLFIEAGATRLGTSASIQILEKKR